MAFDTAHNGAMTQNNNSDTQPENGTDQNGTNQNGTNRAGTSQGGAMVRKLSLIGILAAGLTAFFVFDLGQYMTLDAVRENRQFLQEMVTSAPLFAAVAFIMLYAVATAFSFPGGTLLTLTGGFLFGAVSGTGYVVVGATIGATTLFLVARSTFGDFLRAKTGKWIAKLQDGFHENELSYMLVLRLVPLFPFVVVNIAPAFLGVSTRTYFIATLFGIIPGTAVYATVGAGLGSIFDSGADFTLTGILTPELIAGLVGLGLLSLIPVAYKKFARKSAS